MAMLGVARAVSDEHLSREILKIVARLLRNPAPKIATRDHGRYDNVRWPENAKRNRTSEKTVSMCRGNQVVIGSSVGLVMIIELDSFVGQKPNAHSNAPAS